MPDIYRNWSNALPNLHFHYLTTTPEQKTRNYMQFIYATYPGGSFDTRPLNFSDVDATLSIRKFLLDKIFQTFPHRKFILVADTSNSDVMRDYPLDGYSVSGPGAMHLFAQHVFDRFRGQVPLQHQGLQNSKREQLHVFQGS